MATKMVTDEQIRVAAAIAEVYGSPALKKKVLDGAARLGGDEAAFKAYTEMVETRAGINASAKTRLRG